MSREIAAKIAMQRPTKNPDGGSPGGARRKRGSAPAARKGGGGRDKAVIPAKKTVLPSDGSSDRAVIPTTKVSLPPGVTKYRKGPMIP